MMNPAVLVALPLWFSVAAVSGSDGLDCTIFNPEKPIYVYKELAFDVSRRKKLLKRLIECIEARVVNVDGLYFDNGWSRWYGLRTGLMLAVEMGWNDLAREFLHLHAGVNVANQKGYTAALFTLSDVDGRNTKNVNALKILLGLGADINWKNADGKTLLMRAALRGLNDVLRYLISKGAAVELHNERGETALHKASYWGHTSSVLSLIDAGANVNLQNKKGLTALHEASSAGHTPIVLALLDAGANANLQDKKGLTALHEASNWGRTSIVNALLDAGANVNLLDKNGESALHKTGNGFGSMVTVETVRRLVDAGANVNLQDKNGWTPLMEAVDHQFGDSKIVVELLKQGANKHIKLADGTTAKDLAKNKGYNNLVNLL